MSDLSIQILQPAHGTALAGLAPVPLVGTVSDPSGLFFKWYSSINPLADADNPELNKADHSAGVLNFSSPLVEFGSHVITLAATDQLSNSLAAVQAVTRSAMAGGAPPKAPVPCVFHRLAAKIGIPATDGLIVSKAAATFEILAPVPWAVVDPDNPGSFKPDPNYVAVNGIQMSLNLAPVGAPDPAHSADIALDLVTLKTRRDDDAQGQAWIQRTGALPANLGTGNYTLTLTVSAGGVSTSASRAVNLTA